jgi:hypothetical protein
MYYYDLEIWMLLFILLIVGIGIAASIIQWSLRNQISPMPSSPKVKKSLFSQLPHVKGKVYELGSGWGTLAFPLARHCPSSQVVGLETSTIPYTFCRLWLSVAKTPNLHFEKKDFFDVPLNDAALVVCYLYPEAMKRLKDKFEKELQPGTWVVSNTFAIPGWPPVKIVEVDDIYFTKIYVYRVN